MDLVIFFVHFADRRDESEDILAYFCAVVRRLFPCRNKALASVNNVFLSLTQKRLQYAKKKVKENTSKT